MNALEELKRHTRVVADTGSFELMRRYQPLDATTNPSLILKAVESSQYRPLVRDVLQQSRDQSAGKQLLRLLVQFGLEILQIIPGRVSTEVDAALSFNTNATIQQADEILELYSRHGVSPARVLIKIAATWEGIRAAEVLERRGVACNLTLLFSRPQAMACANAGVTLISPFVGRISDWHKARGVTWSGVDEDPGVQSVRAIYALYSERGYKTEVMGASFRSVEQVLALAGCDLLTVSPELLEGLMSRELQGPLDPALLPRDLSSLNGVPRLQESSLGESDFRLQVNEDAMATDKLSEGIRLFQRDGERLRTLLGEMA
jgi:transaldolase